MLGFEFEFKKNNVLTVFMGQLLINSLEFSSFLKKIYDKNLRPDVVIFIYPYYLLEEVKGYIADSLIDITRYGDLVPIKFYGFDIQGMIKQDHSLNDLNLKFDNNELRREIIRNGINFLIKGRENDVITKAPSGTVFIKPSGSTLEEFIYASQLARGYAESQFLAFGLLGNAPDLKKISWIYIDTASISGVIESVIYYIHKFSKSTCKKIKYKSFSSYSGLEACKPDEPESIWVIISASSSKNLGKKIIEEWCMPAGNVMTILSYAGVDSDIAKGNSILHCVNHISNRQKNTNSPIRVQVRGESFVAEISTPKKIIIKEVHKPDLLGKSIVVFSESQILSCNTKSNPTSGGNVKAKKIFFNYKKFIDHAEYNGRFKKWIYQLVRWEIPRNLGAVICMGSGDHSLFKDRVFEELASAGFDCGQIKSINYDSSDFSGYEDIADKAVLILSPAISSGRMFLDVNRSLRLAEHKGARIFASIYSMPSSKSEYTNFKNSITYGVDGFKYRFIDLYHFFNGHKCDSSWDMELDVVNKILDIDDSEYWQKRKYQLERTGDGLDGILGCNISDIDQKLSFSRDFAFWPPGYEPEDVAAEAVFATIAAVLENLRENKIGEDTLKSTVYEHYILDPENFIRLNDPLIQSCLWRAASPAELDYRSSDGDSMDMSHIILKLVKSKSGPRGQAALDLLMGLATRKIKLVQSHLSQLIMDVKNIFNEKHENLLLSYIEEELLDYRDNTAANLN